MKLSKVARLKVADLHQSHRQGIPHGESRRGGARRGEVQRASLMLDKDLHVDGRVFSQERLGIAAHAYDGYVHVEQNWDEAKKLVRLSGVADGKHHIL